MLGGGGGVQVKGLRDVEWGGVPLHTNKWPRERLRHSQKEDSTFFCCTVC